MRAIIGREALHGSWLTPTLYGEPFLTKPPGMYAAIAAVSAPFGDVTAISSRIPSAIAATVVVLLFYFAFRQIVDRRLALAGAMLLPVSLVWLEKAQSAEIDMLQVAWVSCALFCFLRALPCGRDADALRSEDSASRLTGIWWIAALLCVAAGFLTKWTAPAFFYLAVVPMLAWRQQISLLWSRGHFIGVAVAGLIVALWAGAVASQVGWPLLRDTVVTEAAQRFAPHHGGRAYPWLETLAFPFQVLVACMPWSLLALYSLRPAYFQLWNENGRRLLQLLHCWTWPNLLFWSLPAQHHVRYCLPMCPGLIGLGVMVFVNCLAATRRLCAAERVGQPNALLRKAFAPRLNTIVFVGILIAWCGVKIAFVEAVLPKRTEHRHVEQTASRLSELVPQGESLYLCKLKDEGVLFYYNRPARRFHWDELPARPFHAVLIEAEWRQEKDSSRFEIVELLRDQQGDAIVLVRFP